MTADIISILIHVQYPSELCLIKYCIKYPCFPFSKLIIFICCFSTNVTHALLALEMMEKYKIFKVHRTYHSINGGSLEIRMFFSSNFRSFHVRSFNNIFKNAFYVFSLFFRTMGSFLIIPFVLVKERSFPRTTPSPSSRYTKIYRF